MRAILLSIVAILVLPSTANAVLCYEVKSNYDTSSSATNAANIARSGWGRFNALAPATPQSGNFSFANGKRAFATHNGTLGSIQWVFSGPAVSNSDCNPTIPAPRDPGDNGVNSTNVAFLYCLSWISHYDLSWSGTMDFHGDTFEVKRQNGSGWTTIYNGTGTSMAFSTSASSTTFKMRVKSVLETSPWVTFSTTTACSGGGNL